MEAATLNELLRAKPWRWDSAGWRSISGNEPAFDQPIENCCFGQHQILQESFKKWDQYVRDGKYEVVPVYNEEQIRENPELKGVRLLYFHGKAGKKFTVICPGGAYGNVEAYGEGICPAVYMADRGYHSFILIYRTGKENMMPAPMEDLANAVRKICELAGNYQIDTDDYSVAGFSAGGHAAAEWGTANHGFSKYNLNKPALLILGYAALSTETFMDWLEEEALSSSQIELSSYYLSRIGGMTYTREELREYSVEFHVTEDYPAVYFVHAKDDPMVPFSTAEHFLSVLKEKKIPECHEFIQSGGHGFATGINTEASGWFERAVQYWEKL